MITDPVTNHTLSDRLLRAGIPANTADFVWVPWQGEQPYLEASRNLSYKPYMKMRPDLAGKNLTPAWSLSALIDMLPDVVTFYEVNGDPVECYLILQKTHIFYRSKSGKDYYSSSSVSLLTGAVKTLVWLKEKRLM